MFIYGYWYLLSIALGAIVGTALHELGHQLFCHIVGIKVHAVKYFNWGGSEGEPDGWVIHERPDSVFQSLMITIGPMFSVGIIFVIVWLFAIILVNELSIILQWIAYGLFFGLFPSTWDVMSTFNEIRESRNPLGVLLYPFLAVLWLFSFYLVRIILIIILSIFLAGATDTFSSWDIGSEIDEDFESLCYDYCIKNDAEFALVSDFTCECLNAKEQVIRKAYYKEIMAGKAKSKCPESHPYYWKSDDMCHRTKGNG